MSSPEVTDGALLDKVIVNTTLPKSLLLSSYMYVVYDKSFRDTCFMFSHAHCIPMSVISPPPVKPEGTIGLHSVLLSLRLSVCPSHSFSRLFFAMLSYIWMKVGSKLPYEELQIKFYFRHDWPNISWVIALCLKIVFRTFLGYAFTYLNESW